MRIHYLYLLLLLAAQQAIAVVTVQDQVDEPCAGMYEGYSYLEADMCWQDLRHAPIDSIAQYIAQHPFHNDTTQLAALVYLMNDAYMNNNKERMDQYRTPLTLAAKRVNQPLYIHRLRLMDIARDYNTFSIENRELALSELEELYQYFSIDQDQIVFEEMSDYAFTTLNCLFRINKSIEDRSVILDRCAVRASQIKDSLLYHYLELVVFIIDYNEPQSVSLELYQNIDYHYQNMINLLQSRYPDIYCDARVRKISMLKYLPYLDQNMGFLYLYNGNMDRAKAILNRMDTYPAFYAASFRARLRDKWNLSSGNVSMQFSTVDSSECFINQYSEYRHLRYASQSCIEQMVDTLSSYKTTTSIFAVKHLLSTYADAGDTLAFSKVASKLDSILVHKDIEHMRECVALKELAINVKYRPDLAQLKELLNLREYFQNSKSSVYVNTGAEVYSCNWLISMLYDAYGLQKERNVVDSIRVEQMNEFSNTCECFHSFNYINIKALYLLRRNERNHSEYLQLKEMFDEEIKKSYAYVNNQKKTLLGEDYYYARANAHSSLAELALVHDELTFAKELLAELVAFEEKYGIEDIRSKDLNANIATYELDYAKAIQLNQELLATEDSKNNMLYKKELAKRLENLYSKTEQWDQVARIDAIVDSIDQIVQENVLQLAVLNQQQNEKNQESSNDSKWYCLLLLIPILLYLLRSFPQWFVDKFYRIRLRQEGERTERKRISSKLHDSVGSSLTGLKLKVEQQLKEGNRSPEMEELLSHLSRIHKEVREISHALKDPDFENNRLDALVHYFMDIMSKQKEIKITKSIYGEENLDQLSVEASTALYRCVQELVNNAMKHAAASEISVSLTSSPDSLILIVEDDGLGMTAEQYQQATKKGIGLATCRDRCRELGAQMEIDSRLGRGTIITIILKLVK